jgi:hypothetical protein
VKISREAHSPRPAASPDGVPPRRGAAGKDVGAPCGRAARASAGEDAIGPKKLSWDALIDVCRTSIVGHHNLTIDEFDVDDVVIDRKITVNEATIEADGFDRAMKGLTIEAACFDYGTSTPRSKPRASISRLNDARSKSSTSMM